MARSQPWTLQTSNVTSSLNSIYFISSTTGFAVGDGGKILKTTNGGNTWITQTSGVTVQLNGVYFTSATTGYCVGGSGKILKTTNSGSTWVALTDTSTQYLYGVYFTDANTGYVVGWNGTILKTSNAGSTWTNQTSGITECLYAIHFITSTTGYAVGGSGTTARVLKTTNGGTIWTAQTCGATHVLRTVHFTAIDTGFVAGDNGVMKGTTNGGTNWSTVTSTTTFNIHALCFPWISLGYAICSSGNVDKTINGGSTWAVSATLTANDLLSAFFINPSTGWACGVGGTIIKTTTGGETCTNTANAGSDFSMCSGTPTALNGSGGLIYSWSPSAGLSSTTIANPIANPATTTTYTVTVTQANSCSSTDNVVVTVKPSPSVTAGADQLLCHGDSITLTATGTATIAWNNGVTNGVPFSPSSSGTYIVTATASNGCTDRDTVIVTVNQLPVCEAGSDMTVCSGDSIVLTATGGATYVWNNGITNAVPFIALNSIIYTVTVTDNNGCKALDSVTVTVNPIPPTPIISLDSNMIISDATSGNQWYLNDTLIPGATSQSYTVTTEGNYYVIVTLNNCPSDTSDIFGFHVGINEFALKNFIIYPIPAREHITVDNKNAPGKNYQLNIRNIAGQEMITQTINFSNPVIIDIRGLCNGVYLLQLINEGECLVEKIVIEK